MRRERDATLDQVSRLRDELVEQSKGASRLQGEVKKAAQARMLVVEQLREAERNAR